MSGPVEETPQPKSEEAGVVAGSTNPEPICTAECWTATECPEHGHEMTPCGRSAALETYICCENYMDSTINKRHLWSEHDSTRWYTDAVGWQKHEAGCAQCRGDEDE